MLSLKVFFILGCVVATAIATDQIVGGETELSGNDLKEAEQTLQDSLTKLAAGDGPHYKISKITKATRQVVSGSLYKFTTQLENTDKESKNCEVEIWSQPWLPEGIRVTFECEGEDKIVKKHSA